MFCCGNSGSAEGSGAGGKESDRYVEEIVDDLAAWPNACILPSWTISAVCCVPGGAFPSYAHGYYERDNRFYQAWDAIARDRDFSELD
jgi:glutaconate CoA-transferase subunit A